MLETAGADRVLTMHLHAGQVQGFFQIPVGHLIARPMLTQYFLDKVSDDQWVAVSPDAGRAKLAEKFAGELGVRPAFLTKDRPEHNVAEAGYVIGDVKGKAAILVDDMIDTAGTLVEAARVVKESGATRVFAAATHGVFSGEAFVRLEQSEIEEIVVTDTIPLPPDAPLPDSGGTQISATGIVPASRTAFSPAPSSSPSSAYAICSGSMPIAAASLGSSRSIRSFEARTAPAFAAASIRAHSFIWSPRAVTSKRPLVATWPTIRVAPQCSPTLDVHASGHSPAAST
jgi:hypothetical protein